MNDSLQKIKEYRANLEKNNTVNNATGTSRAMKAIQSYRLAQEQYKPEDYSKRLDNLITSGDINNDGRIGLKDLVRAKKMTASSTGAVKAVNEASTGEIKKYLTSNKFDYNSAVSSAVKKMENNELSTEDKNQFVKTLEKAVNDTELTDEEREYYGRLLNGYRYSGGSNYEKLRFNDDYEAVLKRSVHVTNGGKLVGQNSQSGGLTPTAGDIQKFANEKTQNKPTEIKQSSDVNVDFETLKSFALQSIEDDSYFYRLTGHSKADYLNNYDGYTNSANADTRLKELNDEEAALLIYISETKGQKEAWNYLTEIRDDLGSRKQLKAIQEIKNTYERSTLMEKIGLNAYSVLSNVYKSPLSFGDMVKQYMVKGEFDAYTGFQISTAADSQIRQSAADEIKEGVGIPGLKQLASHLYHAAMTSIDMYVGAATFGNLGKYGYTTTMSLRAGAGKARDLYARGASQGQIAIGATASALIEFFIERGVADTLEYRQAKGIIGSFFDFEEASEELKSGIADIILESILMGKKSVTATEVQTFMREEGLSETEAWIKAACHKGEELFWDYFTGGVSGGMMSAPARISVGITNRQYGNQIQNNNNKQNLIDIALTLPEDTEAYKLAKGISDKGGNASTNRIGELYIATANYVSNKSQNVMKEAVENQLKRYHVANSADVAETIVNMARMRDVDPKERNEILGNNITNRVYSELIGEVTDTLGHDGFMHSEANKGIADWVSELGIKASNYFYADMLVNELLNSETKKPTDTEDYQSAAEGFSKLMKDGDLLNNKTNQNKITLSDEQSLRGIPSKRLVLQSSANGGVTSNKGTQSNAPKDSSKGVASQPAEVGKWQTVEYDDSKVIYRQAAADNSEAYRLYKALINAGNDTVYCDGPVDLVTDEKFNSKEFYTAPDGKLFISNTASSSEVTEIAKELNIDIETADERNTEDGIPYSDEKNNLDSILDEDSDIQNPFSEPSDVVMPLNNSRERHHLNKQEQDHIQKIASALGRTVVFEDIRESAKKLRIDISKGIPDGYIDENDIIHIDFSPIDPIAFVFKHELTHFVEGTKSYELYIKAVKNSKRFKKWLKEQTKLKSNDIDVLIDAYKKIIAFNYSKETNLEAEMYADFTGAILFAEDGAGLKGLLNELTPEERNAFIQFIRNFINWLREKLGNDSIEVRRLEYNFNLALTEATATKKSPTDSGGNKFSISADSKGTFVKVDTAQEIFDGKSVKEMQEIARKLIRDNFKGKVLAVGEDGKAYVNKRSAEEYSHPANKRMKDTEKEAKMRASTELENLLAVSEFIKNEPDDGRHPDATGGWDIYSTRFEVGGQMFMGNVKIKITDKGYVFYDIGQIKRITRESDLTENDSAVATGNPSTDSITENGDAVNNNSMSEIEKDTSDIRFSFARVYDTDQIKSAEKTEQELKAKNKSDHEIRERIWKDHKIIRDAGGIWVYEIDDSEMKFHLHGDAQKEHTGELKEFHDLAKLKRRTKEKSARYSQLLKKYGSPYLQKGKLVDYVKHDVLFEKYPQLKDVNIEFKLLGRDNGSYNPESNTIFLNSTLFLPSEGLKGIDSEIDKIARELEIDNTIIHEIQHVLQHYDERENGSNIEVWNNRLLRGERLPINPETGKELTPEEAYYYTHGEYEARQAGGRKTWEKEDREEEMPDFGWGKTHSVKEAFASSDVKFSIPNSSYLSAVESGDIETAQAYVDEAAKSAGYTERLYHQTGADFTEFNTENQKAGKFDYELPTGTFLKPTDTDIGLSGKKQMELYAKFQNPLHFADRKEAKAYWSENIPEYKQAVKELNKLNVEYRQRVDQAEANTRDYLKKWRNKNPDKDSREIYKDTEYQRLNDIEDSIVDEWEEKADELSLKSKGIVDDFISKNNYDGIIVEKDVGSYGRYTKTYIAFSSAQMKSAEAVTYDDNGNVIPLSERFDLSESDIRYAMPNEFLLMTESYKNGEITKEEIDARMNALWNERISELKEEGDKKLAAKYEKAIEKNKKYSQKLSSKTRQLKNKEEQLKKATAELKLYNEKVTPYGTVSFSENLRLTRQTLSRIKTRLDTNSDKKHIPEELKEYTERLLTAFNRDGIMPFNKESIELMASAYGKFAGNDKKAEQIGFDLEIQELIVDLAEQIDGKTVMELKFTELYSIRQITDNLWYMIQGNAEMFLDGKREEIKTVAENIFNALSEKRNKKALMGAAPFEKVKYSNMLPIYFLEELGEPFAPLMETFMDNEDTCVRNEENAKTYLNEMQKRYDWDGWNNKVLNEIVLKSGEKISLTVPQAIYFYTVHKSEQLLQKDKTDHLFGGGIVVPEQKKGIAENLKLLKENIQASNRKGFAKIFDATLKEINESATALAEDDVYNITSCLTEKQKEFGDKLVEYMTNDGGGLGNQTSMLLFGYCKYNRPYYVPFNTAQDYLFRQFTPTDGNNASIKHSSFTHNLTKGAAVPLVIGDITDIFCDHMAKMSRYNASAVTLDALTKILNYKDENGKTLRVRIGEVYGKKALNYLDTFITDMNGGNNRADDVDDFFKKMISLHKKNAVSASLSVAIQQPTSLPRAFAEIDAKWFVGRSPKSDYEEMLKYCPVAVIKEKGRVDIGTSAGTVEWMKNQSPDGFGGAVKKLFTDTAYRDDKLMWLASKGDQVTWRRIYSAVKREISHTTDLKAGSTEFFEAVNKRFRYVINKTQVYDSPLSRSQIMRSKSLFNKMATSFMGEPTVWLNMFMQIKKKPIKILSVFITAAVLNASLKSLVTAGRDDDEDKTYWEKWYEDFCNSMLDSINPLTYIPYARDIWSLTQGYDVERMDMSIFADVITAYRALSSENKSTYRKIEDFAGSLSSFLGLPTKNVMRDIRAAYNTHNDLFINDKSNHSVKAEVEGYLEELEDNDTYNMLAEEDKENLQKDITSKVRMVEQAKEDKKALDDFDELYELKRNDDKKYQKKRKELIKSGKYTSKEITDGIEIARISYMKSIGIDVNEYLLYKIAVSEKYADKDGDECVSKNERKEAIRDSDLDSNAKEYFEKDYK